MKQKMQTHLMNNKHTEKWQLKVSSEEIWELGIKIPQLK